MLLRLLFLTQDLRCTKLFSTCAAVFPWFDGYLWSLGFVMVRHGRLPSADGEFKRNLYLLPSMGLHINNTIAT